MKINQNLAISESGFLFNPGTGESFTVNPIGAEIIELLRKGMTTDQIIETLSGLYLIDRNTLEKDLQDFIGILKTYSLVKSDD